MSRPAALLALLGDLIARTDDPVDRAFLAKLAERLMMLAFHAELTRADDHPRAA